MWYWGLFVHFFMQLLGQKGLTLSSLFAHPTVRTNPYLYGQISWDFMTHPFLTKGHFTVWYEAWSLWNTYFQNNQGKTRVQIFRKQLWLNDNFGDKK